MAARRGVRPQPPWFWFTANGMRVRCRPQPDVLPRRDTDRLLRRVGGQQGRTRSPTSVMNADGSGSRILVDDLEADRIYNLAWSPDGERLAFGLGSKGIYVVGADGSGFTLAIPGGAYPYWSPDGTRIAFADSRFGPFTVVDMRPRSYLPVARHARDRGSRRDAFPGAGLRGTWAVEPTRPAGAGGRRGAGSERGPDVDLGAPCGGGLAGRDRRGRSHTSSGGAQRWDRDLSANSRGAIAPRAPDAGGSRETRPRGSCRATRGG